MERDGQLRAAFEALDVDGDGLIGRDDLRTVLGSGREQSQIDSMIDYADVDRDGYVAFEEFSKIIPRQHRCGAGRGGIMAEAFKAMDRDGDGLVGFDDLKALMGRGGFGPSDEEIRAMIGLAGGRSVSFDDFLKLVPA